MRKTDSICLSVRSLLMALATVAFGLPVVLAVDEPPADSAGAAIYRRLCLSCHGKSGEGVSETITEGAYDRPLVGDKTIPQLTRIIEKRMPDEAPEECVGEDAETVARYIYDAFYSPIAQARTRPPRVELARLTVRQLRNSVADLIGAFRSAPDQRGRPDLARGLAASYYNDREPRRRPVLRRVDAEVRFDFGRKTKTPGKLDVKGFAARWDGSVIAPRTGVYDFVIRTDQAARLWVNDLDEPLIDRWVQSGSDIEYRKSVYLIDGRAYPIRLDFSSRILGVNNEKSKGGDDGVKALIELVWKAPGQIDEVIPAGFLSPELPARVAVVETPFPPDDQSLGYERGSSASKAWDEATTNAAIDVAEYVEAHLDELAGIRRGRGDRPKALREFASRFVERAFRRPLTASDHELFVNRHFEAAPDLETAVKRVVILALKSPRFLYLGLEGEKPDAYALASRLSFALWDSIPDEALLEAAGAGELATRRALERQAARMLDDPRTRSKLRRFLHQWLLVDHATDLAKKKGPDFAFEERLSIDLERSLDFFLDDVIWGRNPDFRRLLLSNELFVNDRLAKYYGIEPPAFSGFRKVVADRPERRGVLSHPFMMANLSYGETSSPIHRGVFVVRGVLGRALVPPPVAVAPIAAKLHPDLTTRERIALQTRPKSCRGCHDLINPIGFTLEHFDAVGRFRKAENGKPIDASGTYVLPTGEERVLRDARDLAEFLAANDEVHRAFALQLFHTLVKQPIMAYGRDTPEQLRREFASDGYDVRKLLVRIASRAAAFGSDLPDGQGDSPLESKEPIPYNVRDRKPVRRREF